MAEILPAPIDWRRCSAVRVSSAGICTRVRARSGQGGGGEPDLGGLVRPFGVVGQIEPIQANLRYPRVDRSGDQGRRRGDQRRRRPAAEWPQTYEAVHVAGAGALAGTRGGARGSRSLSTSPGIGADACSQTPLSPARGAAEQQWRRRAARRRHPAPVVGFGPEDEFLNRFAALARGLPFLPVFGGGATRLQPVFVGDVALAALASLARPAAAGRAELGGPKVMTLREVMALTLSIAERRRALVSLPFRRGAARSALVDRSRFDAVARGFPQALTMTRDEVELLRHDNVVSATALAEGRTLRELGVKPQGRQSDRALLSLSLPQDWPVRGAPHRVIARR